jgi:hypothetical protein
MGGGYGRRLFFASQRERHRAPRLCSGGLVWTYVGLCDLEKQRGFAPEALGGIPPTSEVMRQQRRRDTQLPREPVVAKSLTG